MLVEEDCIATFEAPPALRTLGISERRADIAHGTACGAQVFHVRLATASEPRKAASLLLRKMYAWRGYAFEVSDDHDANQITLFAETGGTLVGTMSLCLDRAGQLPADENFGDKLDALRRQGRRLAEPARLAIDKGVTKRVFAALIHISYLYAHKLQGFTDYVIEVNPRHVAFYKRMLGFADFGGERPCARVDAPAVLLRLPLDYMGAQIRRWGGTMEQHGAERSFYPYFFPSWDEPGITARLLAGCR
ncbi:N-acyl amino acid synthase FeeM domain-containing protein [Massilia horti]|uniref:Long-chain N-acyl amino acid synthase n=1 Tax=Massilia horti TaxID=2562153 RepID=A0A4Y9T4C6_9BURK|nr:long-chain N-acyl amino acid synthase [Massilia horti]TFW35387.1 long-chain N-acyl amino acid synthase [Massilia horti]